MNCLLQTKTKDCSLKLFSIYAKLIQISCHVWTWGILVKWPTQQQSLFSHWNSLWYWKKLQWLFYLYSFICFCWIGFFKHFYLNIVDLQCCIGYRYMARWFSYMYIKYIFYFYILFHIWLKYWIEFPVLYCRSLLVIYFIYSSVYILIPNF